MPVDFSKTESSIDSQRKDDTKPDVDNLRSEAEVMEKGIYGDDVRDAIDLYTINSPPDQTTEIADDVTLEIGGLLAEPAFRVVLLEEPTADPSAAADQTREEQEQTSSGTRFPPGVPGVATPHVVGGRRAKVNLILEESVPVYLDFPLWPGQHLLNMAV